MSNVNVVLVWQKTENDMSGFSEPVEEERSQKTKTVRVDQIFRLASSIFEFITACTG
jgi:hypothetical protein